MNSIQIQARKNLNIPLNHHIIISLDGGGMRGILTIQLLKKLEEVAGAPIYQWCNMVAGTSTGAIIAGLILKEKTAAEIEDLYKKMVSRVFTKRNLLASRFFNPPAFDKVNYRNILKQTVGDVTLQQCSAKTGLDVMITAKDTEAGEETFFTCFNHNGLNNGADFKGTYQSVLLRGVMEATMSAPTYFLPFERFVDGGTTTYNNPVQAAVLEAVVYDGANKYKIDELTVLSFGTGTIHKIFEPEEVANPGGLDVKFWLNYVMDETSRDASEMQINTLRSGLLNGLSLRRFQLSLDKDTLNLLPNKDISDLADLEADTLHDLSDEVLSKIDMADVSKFGLMERIGQAFADEICPDAEKKLSITERQANWFAYDLVKINSARGKYVKAFGNKEEILNNLSNPAWIDSQSSK